jgi:hypothetical protein
VYHPQEEKKACFKNKKPTSTGIKTLLLRLSVEASTLTISTVYTSH